MSKPDVVIKRCPFCGKTNEVTADWCWVCNAPLSPAALEEAKKQSPEKRAGGAGRVLGTIVVSILTGLGLIFAVIICLFVICLVAVASSA